ncbi:NADPH:quinone reductase [Seinonella peptonophila]|uniref:NADPH:quinone reductase n=1 Tax=Seinonella peptonophila TaxID=112248 RepID=A0A1M4X7B7_9BACL|nr:NADP-dependent oxidoreductase [Seinonella peptonophila]SHE89399.1 NADPH:quinone reductase [Seinonella peptonophila]
MKKDIPTLMKAIRFYDHGGPEVLRYEDVPVPEVGEGEVLVRIHAVGLNPADWRGRAGFLDLPPEVRPKLPLPSIPGFDISGEVVALATGVNQFEIGDLVFGMVRFPPFTSKRGGKAYAQYVTAPVEDLSLKPKTISHLEAAATPMSALTAKQLLDNIDLHEDQTVLINGAAGGVGHFAVQLAKLQGAKVIGVASSRHESFLRKLGVDEYIDYTKCDASDVIQDVDILFDNVGGQNSYKMLQVLKRGGILVPVNYGFHTPDQLKELGIISKGKSVVSNGAQLTEIARLIDLNYIQVAIDSVFPLAEAARAHEKGESGHLQGKIVLCVIE